MFHQQADNFPRGRPSLSSKGETTENRTRTSGKKAPDNVRILVDDGILQRAESTRIVDGGTIGSMPEQQIDNFRMALLRCRQEWSLVCEGGGDIRVCAILQEKTNHIHITANRC